LRCGAALAELLTECVLEGEDAGLELDDRAPVLPRGPAELAVLCAVHPAAKLTLELLLRLAESREQCGHLLALKAEQLLAVAPQDRLNRARLLRGGVLWRRGAAGCSAGHGLVLGDDVGLLFRDFGIEVVDGDLAHEQRDLSLQGRVTVFRIDDKPHTGHRQGVPGVHVLDDEVHASSELVANTSPRRPNADTHLHQCPATYAFSEAMPLE
jgi:hypothetical protein